MLTELDIGICMEPIDTDIVESSFVVCTDGITHETLSLDARKAGTIEKPI
tara:strand:- start:234 stop:383 length:150 start_codon:yes stop_codon:yes gene_type:complete